jgi:hypothetical protein
MTAESSIKAAIRLALGSIKGVAIFNNPQGVGKNPAGQVVKFGVCNPGGSDLIGWTPRVVTPDMVGQQVAIFTAIEVKNETRKPTLEQERFIRNVLAAGGIAGVVRSPDEAVALVTAAGSAPASARVA